MNVNIILLFILMFEIGFIFGLVISKILELEISIILYVTNKKYKINVFPILLIVLGFYSIVTSFYYLLFFILGYVFYIVNLKIYEKINKKEKIKLVSEIKA